ncbi:MAG: hypothetical protein ACRDLF_02000 [Solirubrobacteraceae bacterium]
MSRNASSPLFATPARWGYEYVEPVPAAESPDHGNPPKLKQVRTIPRARANGLWEAAVAATAGTVVTLTLDSALRLFSISDARGAAREVALILVNLLAAAVAFWVARVWQQSAERRPGEQLTPVQRDLLPALVAFVCFFLPYLVLAVEALLAWRRVWLAQADLVPDPKEAALAEQEHRQAVSAWKKRLTQFDTDERARLEAVDRWYPVPFSGTPRTTCVFGGGADSWTAALATLGASLLGSGVCLTIGDLSQRLTAHELLALCGSAGIPATEAVFAGALQPPATGSGARLEIVGLNKHTEDSEHERDARQLFQALLSQVRQGQAQAGVLVILGADRVEYDDLKSLITAAEREQLRVLLFFEQFRRHAVEIAGAGGAAAAFFALGNHLEAEEASRFIGTQQAWVLAHKAASEGGSHTQTPGWAESTAISAGGSLPLGVSFGVSRTLSHSYSESTSQSAEYTEGEELTSEAVVKTGELRGLRSTELIYVELLPDGRPAATKLNCRLDIAAGPQVSRKPRRVGCLNQVDSAQLSGSIT